MLLNYVCAIEEGYLFPVDAVLELRPPVPKHQMVRDNDIGGGKL